MFCKFLRFVRISSGPGPQEAHLAFRRVGSCQPTSRLAMVAPHELQVPPQPNCLDSQVTMTEISQPVYVDEVTCIEAELYLMT